MYSCFIQIPSAMARSLALRPIRLGEYDYEDADADEVRASDVIEEVSFRQGWILPVTSDCVTSDCVISDH